MEEEGKACARRRIETHERRNEKERLSPRFAFFFFSFILFYFFFSSLSVLSSAASRIPRSRKVFAAYCTDSLRLSTLPLYKLSLTCCYIHGERAKRRLFESVGYISRWLNSAQRCTRVVQTLCCCRWWVLLAKHFVGCTKAERNIDADLETCTKRSSIYIICYK